MLPIVLKPPLVIAPILEYHASISIYQAILELRLDYEVVGVFGEFADEAHDAMRDVSSLLELSGKMLPLYDQCFELSVVCGWRELVEVEGPQLHPGLHRSVGAALIHNGNCLKHLLNLRCLLVAEDEGVR